MSDPTHQNLLAGGPGPQPALLPIDPAVAELAADGGRERFIEIVSAYPASSLCWALLAEGSLKINTPDGDVAAYAYARTGYHRGLDALRRAGWKGSGPIPWEHAPNRGFLRALYALAHRRPAHRGHGGVRAVRAVPSRFLRDRLPAADRESASLDGGVGDSPPEVR